MRENWRRQWLSWDYLFNT